MSVIIDNLIAGYNNTVILKEIKIKIKKGCICALLGRNGSGKTTLFRCISGLLKPMSGNIYIENKKVEELNRRQLAELISFVPQKTNSVFSYSVLEMVLMGETAKIDPWGRPDKRAYDKAYEACKEIGIKHLVYKKYNELSGGEQQLVLIARAIMQDCPLMLLDEPTSHLDFANQHMIMDLLKDLVRKRKVTVIITLHNPNLAANYSDEVIMIDEGKIIASGNMHELFNDNNLIRMFGSIVRTDYTTCGLKVAVPTLIK